MPEPVSITMFATPSGSNSTTRMLRRPFSVLLLSVDGLRAGLCTNA